MTYFYRLLMVFFLIPVMAISQDDQNMSLGVRCGLNIGTPYVKPEKGSTGALGIGPRLGFFLRLKVNDRFDLQCEALYSVKGGTYGTPVSGDTVYEQVLLGVTYFIPTFYKGYVEGKFDNRYIDFPLQARYLLSQRFNLMFGPQISYLLKGKNSGLADIDIGMNYSHVSDEPFDTSDQINKWDYSFLFGCNYETFGGLNADIGISFGLRSIFKEGYNLAEGTVRNIYLQCSLGYRFGAHNIQ
ncbi:MAG: porin family protein [Bacteroidetes bacterium]|nr:porin family protein [Bacteroidota bacterium]